MDNKTMDKLWSLYKTTRLMCDDLDDLGLEIVRMIDNHWNGAKTVNDYVMVHNELVNKLQSYMNQLENDVQSLCESVDGYYI